MTFGSDHQLKLWDISTGQDMMVNFGRVENRVSKKLQMDISSSSSPQVQQERISVSLSLSAFFFILWGYLLRLWSFSTLSFYHFLK